MSEFNKKNSSQVDDDSSDDEAPPPLTEEAAQPEEPAEDATCQNSEVTNKYQEAAKICQAALLHVESLCAPGATVLNICKAGDALLMEKTAAIFRGKNKAGKLMEKGISFPTCVSVNSIVCHCSPLETETQYAPLKADDIVKIDLGCHIDGYIATGAHTVIVGQAATKSPVTGGKANVIAAAWAAADVAAKMIKPGNTNAMVTEAIKKCADAYGVKPIAGTVMHQMKRFVIDAAKTILLKQDDENKVDLCTFEQYEVYSIDIAMSTGEGKIRDSGARTTVFKRVVDQKYGLKVKASRAFFNDVIKTAPTMPFSLRSFADEKAAKMGVRECVSHNLLVGYPVLCEKDGEFVAHVKYTVLLLGSGTQKITGLPRPLITVADDIKLPEDIVELLATEDKQSKKAKKRADKKATAITTA